MARAQIVLGIPNPDDDRPGLYLHTPYDAEFVDRLKELPIADRRWVRHEGAWWVHRDYLETIRAMTMDEWGSYELIDEDGAVETFSPGAHTRQERLL